MIACLSNPFGCFTDFVLVTVPWWVWALAAVTGFVIAWRLLGWQGLLALGAAVGAFFTYRQGYRDGRSRTPPAVPIEDYEHDIAPPPRKRNGGLLRRLRDRMDRS